MKQTVKDEMKNIKVTEANHLRFMRLKTYPQTQDEFLEILMDTFEMKVAGEDKRK